jgi:hypothetical protein
VGAAKQLRELFRGEIRLPGESIRLEAGGRREHAILILDSSRGHAVDLDLARGDGSDEVEVDIFVHHDEDY